MTAPLLLALDISKARTGVAEGRVGEVPRAYSIESGGTDDVAALMKLGHWLLDKIKADKPSWIFYEAPLDAGAFQPIIDWDARKSRSQRDPHTTVILAKLTGIVEFIAAMKSIPARPVNVKTARVSFCGVGSGNIKGDEGKQRAMEMSKMLGWPCDNFDVTDANCVWFHGCTVAKPNDAAIITPMMQIKCATLAAAVLAERAETSRRRAPRKAKAASAELADIFGKGAVRSGRR